MAVWSDMNGFPEGGFPVLANANDMITLGNLYLEPLKANQYMIDVLGNNRLAGALVIAGALSGVGALSMSGALSGVTTLAANNTVTLSHATAPLTLSGSDAVLAITGANAILRMSGLNSAIGSALERIGKAYFKKLYLDERPIVGEDLVALISDVTTAIAKHTLTHAPSDADNTLSAIAATGTSGGLADGQNIVINDTNDGLLKQATVSDLRAYFDTIYAPL